MRATLLTFLFAALLAAVGAQTDCPTTTASQPCQLTDGLASDASIVMQGGKKFYDFQYTHAAGSSEALTFSLSVLFGDADLFITVPSAAGQPAAVPQPNAFNYSSDSSGSSDVVVLPAEQLVTGTATYRILVYGFLTSSYRLLIASGGSTAQLFDGQPQQDDVPARSYDFFKFVVPAARADEELTITVTPLSGGDPDLYVSSVAHEPTATTAHTLHSRAIGGDTVTIDDSHHSGSGDTTYYIGVYGYPSADADVVAYVITAHLDSPIQLLPGVPQHGTVSRHGGLYYSLAVAAGDEVTIRASPEAQANVDLFVRAQPQDAPRIEPNATNAQWRSDTHWFGPEMVHVDGDAALTGQGWYNIQVYGRTDANFTITASTQRSVTVLQSGVAAHGTVSEGGYAYYQFHVSNASARLTFDVTPLSGDPDLYVACTVSATGTADGTPSEQDGHFSWSSANWGEDALSIAPDDPAACPTARFGGGGATYYIAVRGYVNSAFTLLARTASAAPALLADGQPQTGIVATGGWLYFRYHVGATASNITVSITPRYGDPDLYISPGTTLPTRAPGGYVWRSRSGSGRDSVTIASDDAQACTRCWLTIGVYGFQAARFSISAVSHAGAVQLVDGTPVQATLPSANQRASFYYTLTSPAHTLAVTATALSGDPDLFVSPVWQHPGPETIGNQTYWSRAFGDDLVVIHNPHEGRYYITVLAYSATTFTLTAHAIGASGLSTLRTLLPGQPQAAQVAGGSYIYYALALPETALTGELTLALTPLSGGSHLSLLANTCTGERSAKCDGSEGGVDHRPLEGNAQFAGGSSVSRQTLTIQPAQLCTACTLVVAVYGSAVPASQSARFTLVATIGGQLTQLADGQPHRGSVAAGSSDYYVLRVLEAHEDVTVAVTPFTGDPDIFIDYCRSPLLSGEPAPADCNTHPSQDQHRWAHRNFGADTITIPASEGCRPSSRYACQYFIAVYGYHASSYTIVARQHSDIATALVDGVPQAGQVNHTITAQFRMAIGGHDEGLQIALTSRYGDADLYVTLPYNASAPPTPHHYNYDSLATGGRDQIDLSAAQVAAGCAGSDAQHPCYVGIGVHGYTDAAFTVVATTGGENTQLRDGVPQRGSVAAGASDYYDLEVADPASPVVFMVTSFSGDPDLFVSAEAERPNATNAAYSSRLSGTDVISIEPNDDGSCTSLGMQDCVYHAGVYGYSASSYQILGHVAHNSSRTELSDGVPQGADALPALAWNYYSFSVGTNHDDIDIVVTPRSGSVALFITNELSADGRPKYPYWTCSRHSGSRCSLWEVHNWRWSSIRSFSRERVTISADDPHFCADCTYTIGVVGVATAAGGSNYSIVAATSDAPVTLQPGIPHQDGVRAGNYEYFHVAQAVPGALTITVTPFYGDPDLYVSRPPPAGSTDTRFTMRPNVYHHIWRSLASGRDALTIQPSDTDACQPQPGAPAAVAICDYYIAVYGFTNSSFSIVATVDDSFNRPQLLLPGVPQQGHVNVSSTRYYSFTAQPQQSTYISITPRYGDPDLYITTDGSLPSRSNSDYHSLSSAGADRITIHPTDAQNQCAEGAECVLNIAVYGFRDSSFSIVAASGTEVERLRDGVSTSATIQPGSWAYYSIGVEQPDADLTITATALSGDPDLYVIVSNPNEPEARPTLADSQWYADSVGSESLVIRHTDADYVPSANYVIGVYAYGSQAAQFTLTAHSSVDAVISLIPGTPQAGIVDGGSYRYYQIELASVEDTELRVQVTTTSGVTAMYLTNRYLPGQSDVPLPTSENYMWRTGGANQTRDRITINTRFPDFRPIGLYTIGVLGLTGAHYSITATTTLTPVVLQAGVPSDRHVAAAGSTEHFVFSLPDANADVTFAVTPLYGDPDLAISTQRQPDCHATTRGTVCSGATWYEQFVGADVLNLTAADPCAPELLYPGADCSPSLYRAGVFYISVFAYSDSAFTVMVTMPGLPTTLLNGSPTTVQTSLQRVCSDYGESTSTCAGESTRRQVAFLTFKRLAGRDPVDLMVTIEPLCAGQADCQPLPFYVSACSSDYCYAPSRHPAPGRADLASNGHSTVFLPRSHPRYCDNSEQDCSYFVAVYSADGQPAAFRATYSTADGVTLISGPCIESGVCTQPSESVPDAASKSYEVYVGNDPRSIDVQVEPCFGSPSLFICDDSCTTSDTESPFQPSASNNRWSATPAQQKGVLSVPISRARGTLYMSVLGHGASAHVPSDYQLTVRLASAPALTKPASVGQLTAHATAHGLSVSWQAALLDGKVAKKATYRVFALPAAKLGSYRSDTACGLVRAAQELKSPPSSSTGEMTAQLSGLKDETDYVISVVATCDAECSSGNGKQSVSYDTLTVTTLKGGAPSGTPALVFILIPVVLLAAVAVFLLYRRNRHLERKLQYELSDVRNVATVSSADAAAPPPRAPKLSYAPLLTTDGDDSSGGAAAPSVPLARRISERLRGRS